MIEILLLIGAVGAISSFARGRGGSPRAWGALAAFGYVATLLIGSIVTSGQSPFAVAIAAWGWIGAIAVYTRFVLGQGQNGPSGSWSCPECKVMNRSYALQCDACGQPYRET